MLAEGWEALSPRYRRMPGAGDLREAAVRQLEDFARSHDLRAQPFMVEPYFQVEAGPGVTLMGRLDRIDEEPGGSLHVIDYKTSAEPQEVDAGQLRLYAIMVEAKLGRSVSRASFWYLGDGQVWTLELSEEDKRQACAELLAAAKAMTNVAVFPPTMGRHCAHCPYLYACEFREEIQRRRGEEGW